MSITTSTGFRYARSLKVDETRVGDRVVLYHRDSGSGVVLNPSGSFLWDSTDEPRTIEDLTRRLAAKYPGASLDRIASDVSAFIQSLLAQDLLSRSE